jgi:hypothetical protein
MLVFLNENMVVFLEKVIGRIKHFKESLSLTMSTRWPNVQLGRQTKSLELFGLDIQNAL